MWHRNRIVSCGALFLGFVVLFGWAGVASARDLPGVLGAETVAAARAKGKTQWEDAQQAVGSAAGLLGYSESQIARALQPTMAREFTFDKVLHDGTVIRFEGFRYGYAENKLANTGKISKKVAQTRHETNAGGVRMHYGVNAHEVRALALKMDTKLAVTGDALAGHAFRGAKGGIGMGTVVRVGSAYRCNVGDKIDPAELFDAPTTRDPTEVSKAQAKMRKELMREFARAYVAAGGAVGPGLDKQAGDVNTKLPEMQAASDEYVRLGHGQEGIVVKSGHLEAGVTGKTAFPLDPLGGILYRKISTGDGEWMTSRLAAKQEGLTLKGAIAMTQGMGEVGLAWTLGALKDGVLVVGVQEVFKKNGKTVYGTLVHPKGEKATVAELKHWIKNVVLKVIGRDGQDIDTFEGGKYLAHFHEGKEVSQFKTDLVGLNAMGGVVNRKSIKEFIRSGTHYGGRKILTEGANLATTSFGARFLERSSVRKNLVAIAGELANPGGVNISNVEVAQNIYGEMVTDQTAQRYLQKTVNRRWRDTLRLQRRLARKGIRVSVHKAIELLAVDSMMKRSLRLRGAPRVNIEKGVISRSARVKVGNPFAQPGTKRLGRRGWFRGLFRGVAKRLPRVLRRRAR